jgi:hypothetical protein
MEARFGIFFCSVFNATSSGRQIGGDTLDSLGNAEVWCTEGRWEVVQ